MARNIEIKARIADFEHTRSIVERLSDQPGQTIDQEDIFFHVPTGRIKLRILAPDHGELIFYQRDDISGPKTSTYEVVKTESPAALCGLLGSAYGELVRVRKCRNLYYVGRTRIHLDRVEGLGEFLELEVVLDDDEPTHEGEAEAQILMQKLGVSQEALISVAYADLLLRTGQG